MVRTQRIGRAAVRRVRRLPVIGAAVVLAATVAAVGAGSSAAVAPAATAPQDYDLTGPGFCTGDTGLAAPALNVNLLSNPGAEYAVTRGSVPGGAGTASGTSIPDPDGVLLPTCWELTSMIAGTDPTNEIAGVRDATYPGMAGEQSFYGGRSANDKAPAGTVTTARQVVSLGSLGDVAGAPYALSGFLGGYLTQDDNTVVTAIFRNANGVALDTARLGPVLADDRGDTSAQVLRNAYGTVPEGATGIDVTLTFTMGSSGHNDAMADSLSLIVGESAIAPTAQNYDETGTCPNPAGTGAERNLIANPGAEDTVEVPIPYATGGSVTDPGLPSAMVSVPACWVSHADLPAPDAVVKSLASTPGNYPGTAGGRVFYGGSASTAMVPDPSAGYRTDVQGTTTTATQVIDLADLDTGEHTFELSGLLGGYSTQGDFGAVTATFLDGTGVAIGAAQIGPITEQHRAAAAEYLTYIGRQYSGTDPTAYNGLLPVRDFGKLPAGTTQVRIVAGFTATSAGNENNGMADDLSFIVDPTDSATDGQSYDLTTGTHGGLDNCPVADRVTPTLDSNLIANPGAEDWASGVWFGAPGDESLTLPACWVSSSDIPAPGATLVSHSQSTSSYPPARDGSRVFWGGTNPNGGIAGITTKARQTIDLSALGDVGGKSFKLSGLLGGYLTQNDNAMVSVMFTDGGDTTLGRASIGPIRAAQRGSVNSLVPQAWYGTVPDGTTTAVVTIVITAVNSGNDSNGEADDLNLTVGDSTTPTGAILQTMGYTAGAGSDGGTHTDPGSGAEVPNLVEGSLYRPTGVSAADGVVYVSNTGDNVLATLDQGVTTVIAGSLEAYGLHGDGGPATDATLYQPAGTAVGADGTVYVADSANSVIRKIDPHGVISRVAGTGTAGVGRIENNPNATGTRTALNRPQSVALGADGNVFIADTVNNRVLEMSSNGRIHTVAGSGNAGYSGDGKAATHAELNLPTAVALDAKGNVYIADAANNVIRRVDATTSVISTVAGNFAAGAQHDGLGGFSGDGGPATDAQLNDPQGVAMDGAGNLYIADTLNHAIRRVAPDGTISTVVNAAGTGGSAPLPGGESSGSVPSSSRLNTPHAVSIDASTQVLFIADTKNSAIAEVLNVAQPGTAAGPTGR